MSAKGVLFSTLLLIVVLNPSAARGAEWFVDASVAQSGDGKTPETAFKAVQEGIDAAGDGEKVSVAAGDYSERLLVRKSLSLIGSGADVTTIDAGEGPSAVTFTGLRYETVSAKDPPFERERSHFSIEGFAVTNSTTDAVGAIYCSYGSVTVKDCKITANSATFGAGIFLDESSAVISGCELSGNSAAEGAGAIYAWASEVAARNCVISGNSAPEGGGLFCWSSEPRLVRTVVSKNAAEQGGAVFCEEGPVVLVNCTVAGNSASEGVGGIHFQEATPGPSVLLAMNSILWGNGLAFSGRWRPAVRFSNVEGQSFSGPGGNTSAPPMFVDAAAGDYNVESGSPCIDAGNPDLVYNDEDGSRCDMGAFGGTGDTRGIVGYAGIAHVTTETFPSFPWDEKRVVIYWIADPAAGLGFRLQRKEHMHDSWSDAAMLGPDEEWLHEWVDTFHPVRRYEQAFYIMGTVE